MMSRDNAVVFIDLDDVLNRFYIGACEAHGKAPPPVAERTWAIAETLGLSPREFWMPLENPEFWAGLAPAGDGLYLLDMIRTSRDLAWLTLAVCSSSECPGGPEGKLRWLEREAPELLTPRPVFARDKWLLAGPGKVLLDDNDGNVEKFIKHGGQAILIPRPWNARAKECLADGSFVPYKIYCELRSMVGV